MYFSIKANLAKTISSKGAYEHTSSISVKYILGSEYRYTTIVSKKRGNAVERNRVKRVIRELMRMKKTSYPYGSYMIYYRRKCNTFNCKQIKSDLDLVMKRISQAASG